jgi:hypothetical protein
MVSQPQTGMARSYSCGTCAALCGEGLLYPDIYSVFPIAGEKLATRPMSLLRDQRATFSEAFAGFTFTKFDGTTVTV